MPFYEWSESMSVGVHLLDDDNKRIIGIINQLHECVQHGSPTDVLDDIFDSLIANVEFHFSREEKVIEACVTANMLRHPWRGARHDVPTGPYGPQHVGRNAVHTAILKDRLTRIIHGTP